MPVKHREQWLALGEQAPHHASSWGLPDTAAVSCLNWNQWVGAEQDLNEETGNYFFSFPSLHSLNAAAQPNSFELLGCHRRTNSDEHFSEDAWGTLGPEKRESYRSHAQWVCNIGRVIWMSRDTISLPIKVLYLYKKLSRITWVVTLAVPWDSLVVDWSHFTGLKSFHRGSVVSKLVLIIRNGSLHSSGCVASCKSLNLSECWLPHLSNGWWSTKFVVVQDTSSLLSSNTKNDFESNVPIFQVETS
jgi:hypothetical protein